MSALSDLVDELLERDFESSPVLASSLGLTDYDSGMDDLSATAFAQREADAVGVQAALRGAGRRRAGCRGTHRSRPCPGHASRAAHQRRVAGLEARPADLLGSGGERRLQPVPASPPAGRRPGGRRGHASRARDHHLRAGPRQPRPGAGTSAHRRACPGLGAWRRPLHARPAVARGACRRARGAAARGGHGGGRCLRGLGRVPQGLRGRGTRRLGLRRGALQPRAARARGPALRRAQPARDRPGRVRPTRRGDERPRPRHRGHAGLARGGRDGRPGPPPDRGLDAPGLRGLDRPRP